MSLSDAKFKCTLCGSYEIIDENDYFRGKVVVKREDLQRWKEIFDLPYAEFTHPDGRYESDYIKEEYKIE